MINLAYVGYNNYDLLCQTLDFEISKNLISIKYILDFPPHVSKDVNGISIESLEDIDLLTNDNINYFIVDGGFTDKYYIYLSQYIDEDKIIFCEVITKYVGFELLSYLKILESNISIISDSCWGGMLYNSLGLKFRSPLINTQVLPKDYLELINNPKFYFSCELELYKERDAQTPPIGILNNTVKIMFNHYETFSIAKEYWDRRKERINYNNIFIQMGDLSGENNIKKFMLCPFDNKIGFSIDKTPYNNIICLKQYEDVNIRLKCGSYTGYIQTIINANPFIVRPINVFKMLLQEQDFIRIN